jgi:hypothetical protein
MTTSVSPEQLAQLLERLHPFDGYPYVVTRVVGAMRHIIVVPAEWRRAELVELAQAQRDANDQR